MARLYSNENFPLPAVEALRNLGHDVQTTQEAGKAGIALPDEDVLALGVEKKRTILTLNRRHFIRLHGVQPNHYGIIVCTFDPEFTKFANRIHSAIKSNKSLAGKLIRVNRPA